MISQDMSMMRAGLKSSRDIVILARFERALPPDTGTSILQVGNCAEHLSGMVVAGCRNASCYLRQSSAPGMDQRDL